eukprot:15469004-Alexandrium_andersonii.AAC.1
MAPPRRLVAMAPEQPGPPPRLSPTAESEVGPKFLSKRLRPPDGPQGETFSSRAGDRQKSATP